ncbi:Fumarate hydratase class II [compost metagenome]
MQAGSSIMPGKVNPVMAEMVGIVAMRVIANDTAVTLASAGGQLELNAYMPLIAESLLESLELLREAVELFTHRCVCGIRVNKERCREHLENSAVLAAAFIGHIGYENSAAAAARARREGITVRQALLESGLLPEAQIDQIISLQQVTKPGIPGI